MSGVERGFAAELWSKGWLWDRLLGTVWIPLTMVEYATDVSGGLREGCVSSPLSLFSNACSVRGRSRGGGQGEAGNLAYPLPDAAASVDLLDWLTLCKKGQLLTMRSLCLFSLGRAWSVVDTGH